MSQYKLSSEIIKLSESEIWDKAKLEWFIKDIYFADSPEECLCGHADIKECCVLVNKYNGNYAIVGNVCVNKFLEIASIKLFDAIKRVKKDVTKSLNAEAIDYAFQKKWVNEWEYDFYLDTLRKRNMTEKQATKRIQINEKIIRYITNYSSV